MARTAFVMLFLLMVINYLDRQVVVAMFESLRTTWNLSDGQLGFLVSTASIALALGAIPLSLLADRWSRVRSITVMAIFWGAATMLGSIAPGYASLLVTRALVGVGEAAYGAVGIALLASLFPQERRGAVLGAFFVASILGAMLGVALGGALVQHGGWRFTLLVTGTPGIVLALVFFVLMRRLDVHDRAPPPPASAPSGTRAILAAALAPRTLRWACLGAGFQLLPAAMIYAWLPTFLAREYALDGRAAGIGAAIFVLATGVGIFACGALADRMGRRVPGGRLWIPIAGSLLTFALLTPAFAWVAPGTAQLALLAASTLPLMSSVGPVSAVVLDVAPAQARASAAAVLALVQNLFGLAGGPLIAGLLSDRVGLQAALACVPVVSLAAALCFLVAHSTYVAEARSARGA